MSETRTTCLQRFDSSSWYASPCLFLPVKVLTNSSELKSRSASRLMRQPTIPPKLCLSLYSIHVLFCALPGKPGRQRHWCASPVCSMPFIICVPTAKSDCDCIRHKRGYQYDYCNVPVVSQELEANAWLVKGV
jgi:hypothetical protein